MAAIIWRRVTCFLLWHRWGTPTFSSLQQHWRNPDQSPPDQYEHRCERCGKTEYHYHPQSTSGVLNGRNEDGPGAEA